MAKVNSFCSVAGCRTKSPHAEDSVVAGLINLCNQPHNMAALVHDALRELGNAACNELAHDQFLAFISRLRQIEEIHFRTLYLLLFATPNERDHILSGAMPNGLRGYYRKINEAVFNGQGDWEAAQAGLYSGEFTVMDNLNEGAHVSYPAMLSARGWTKHPEHRIKLETYQTHLQSRLAKWRYIHQLFNTGKSREHVLEAVKTAYRSVPEHTDD